LNHGVVLEFQCGKLCRNLLATSLGLAAWSASSENACDRTSVELELSKHLKITILLATRNGAEFIEQQLESYRSQIYSNWELLVSDDGSTDGTVDLIEKFSKSVTQAVTICRGPQLGFWQNFASLVRSKDASGDLLAFSDQDDIWFADKLKNAVDWFEPISEDRPALYFTRTQLISRNGAELGFSRKFTRAPSFENALVQNIGGGNTMVFNRAAQRALQKNPASATIVAHDWWAYQMVTGIGGLVHYDLRPSLAYRQHGQNLVGKNVGLGARLKRAHGLISGQMANWNDINLRWLGQIRAELRPENIRVLECFARARTGWLPQRLWLLWRSGVYRQTFVENVALFVGATIRRL
jgi:glycosyltransferase involved in cell wall biosynthesis